MNSSTLKTTKTEHCSRIVKSTCAYCGVGCGLNIHISNEHEIIKISGDSEHPANYGRLCSKGSALAETLSLEGRLLHPEVQGKRSSWSDAIHSVADGFKKL